jgi:hypothetical protein
MTADDQCRRPSVAVSIVRQCILARHRCKTRKSPTMTSEGLQEIKHDPSLHERLIFETSRILAHLTKVRDSEDLSGDHAMTARAAPLWSSDVSKIKRASNRDHDHEATPAGGTKFLYGSFHDDETVQF